MSTDEFSRGKVEGINTSLTIVERKLSSINYSIDKYLSFHTYSNKITNEYCQLLANRDTTTSIKLELERIKAKL